MQPYKFLFFIMIVLISCQDNKSTDTEKSKKEITNAEKSFETMAAEKGIAEAFWFFADSNAVIKRQNDTLIQGKENIRKFYSADFYTKASVKWSPDFVEVSSGGDLGYTYGKYVWQSKDSTGKTEEYKGIFHTVWKKQKDGGWKYVWD
jgi:ketosteroid isomerase-like protein